MTTLLSTIIGEKGELFAIGGGRRVLFARCKPEIRIYEKSTQLPVLGKQGGAVKKVHFTVALCGNMDFTVDEETALKAERYELSADILRGDGIIERFYFHNISLLEINTNGEWEFELFVPDEQQLKLTAIAGI